MLTPIFLFFMIIIIFFGGMFFDFLIGYGAGKNEVKSIEKDLYDVTNKVDPDFKWSIYKTKGQNVI
jgi:mannose/fructose/N-acetylgalactosamine-specific phosphotransferase system component IID